MSSTQKELLHLPTVGETGWQMNGLKTLRNLGFSLYMGRDGTKGKHRAIEASPRAHLRLPVLAG